jgi:CHAT domain-containing protein
MERTKMGTALLADVTNTRTAIMKHQKTALLGLQILTELLVAPVRDHIWYCSNIIFAPHEILHSVPFCGLHNKETFLIQEKTISLISSVRALHQCFIQQQAFEVACRSETVGLAFVAGNPEPLGLGLDQLQGATEEAEEVAELLNVEAIVCGRVTKEAVIKDLSSACLVVLGTHGVVDPAHAHGALFLQGCKPLLSVSQSTKALIKGREHHGPRLKL